MTTLPHIASILRAARCPECDGSGMVVGSNGYTEYVTLDMARDAGDASLVGSIYREEPPEAHQCQWCAERDAILTDIEDPSTTAQSLVPNAQS